MGTGNRILQPFALTLITLAMLLRVAIPAGWMPTTGADGQVRIALCTGTGAQTAWVDAAGKIHREGAPAHPGDPSPCAFAALAFAADLPTTTAVTMPHVAPAVQIAALSPLIGIGRGLAAPPPPSTGPPA